MADPIVDLPESLLIKLLYEEILHFPSIAIPPQCPWPCAWRLEVRPEQLDLPQEAFGDVDALLVPEGVPEQARVVQFKRVKIKQTTFQTERPNKLRELQGLSKQANDLVKVGFAYVWAIILVVTDSRERNRGAPSFLGATPRLLDQIHVAIGLNDFAPCVGVHVAEIAQPMDKPITEWSSTGGHILRLATGQTQPSGLTEAICRLVAANQPPPNPRLQVTAGSVRSCVAPTSSRS